MKLKYTLAALVVTTCTSQAALILTGGNFEDGRSVDWTAVDNFFESSGAGYGDYITSPAGHFSTNQTRVFGLNGGTGYIYQSLGAYTNESTIAISGDSLIRDLRPSPSGDGPSIFEIYQAPAASTGANGTPVSGITGASLLGSFTLTPVGLHTGDTYTFASGDIDISGATVGNNIWLSVKPTSTASVLLDNLAITTTVPEPSSAAFLGLGGLALILRRRK